jgi:hypothetical protein
LLPLTAERFRKTLATSLASHPNSPVSVPAFSL